MISRGMIFCKIASSVSLPLRLLLVLVSFPAFGLRLVLEGIMYSNLEYLNLYVILSVEKFSLSCLRLLSYPVSCQPCLSK